MNKIKVAHPVVELDGDEMTRIIWHYIRDKLIHDLFDASHMLAPLAVTTSLGVGNAKVPLAVPFGLNANGNCITLSARL